MYVGNKEIIKRYIGLHEVVAIYLGGECIYQATPGQQNDYLLEINEYIDITNITATGELKQIYYSNTKHDENIEIANIAAEGILTHINNL